MSTPDVRVRLSPEGIKEVIFALRQIDAESKKARQSAGSGLGTIKQALSDLKSLLPTIGLAAAIGGFIAMTKNAVKTADATGKLADQVGGTTEEVSALNLAFRQNESDQEGVRTSLIKTTQVLGEVRAGSQETVDALRAIGVNTKAITNLSAPRALEEIARKLAAIKDPGERSAATFKIFGKQAQNITLALTKVGQEGIDPFIAKARELGVLIDDDFATAAAQANDALVNVKIQAEGAATAFAAGLAPAVADAMTAFSDAVGGAGTAFKKFGEGVGFIVRFIVFVFVGLGKTIGAEAAKIMSFINAIIEATKAVAKGDFSAAGEAFRRSAKERADIEVQRQADIQEAQDKIFKPGGFDAAAEDKNPRGAAGASSGDVELIDAQRKAAAARRAAQQQALQEELKTQQEHLKSMEAANQAAYDQGLISLQEFFAKRREIQERQNSLELAALAAQRKQLVDQLNASSAEGGPESEADKIKIRQQIAQLDAQIARQRIQAARELAAIDAEQAAAQKALGQELAQQNIKLLELEGKRHEAFQANLELELQAIRELGVRAGQTAEQIEANVKRIRDLAEAGFAFDELQRKGQDQLDSFTREKEQIQRDMELGLISQAEGERRILELERQRLELLEQLAQQMLAAAEASGNEEQIKKAREFADEIAKIRDTYQSATDFATRFKNAGLDSFQSGLADLLANADKIENLGDAFKNLARSVVDSLKRMVAEFIAQQVTLLLMRSIFGGLGGGFGGATQAGSGVSGIFAGMAQKGGRIRGMASGGDVVGPTLNIPGPDKVPILAQSGEFMVRKAKVMEPGALAFLRAWNGGRFRLADVMTAPRFAEGGAIGAAQGTAGAAGGNSPSAVQLRLINLVDPNLVQDALNSASGERSVMNVISKNSTAVRRLLGV